MRKHIYLFVCISVCLILLSGCKINNSSVQSVSAEKNSIEAVPKKSIDTTDWKPTTCVTVNNFDGVTMAVKKGAASPDGLTASFENSTDKQCIYGENFSLEKKIDGDWYQVPVTINGNYGFNTIGYNLDSHHSGEWKVEWKWLYGSLDKGEYRIVKDILDFRGTGDYDTYILAAEFSID